MSTQVAHNLNQQEEARQGLFRSQAVEKLAAHKHPCFRGIRSS